MIHSFMAYCKYEDVKNIENYELAKADNFRGWQCHHRLEIHDDYRNSREELIMMGLYYQRPACELIFMKKEDHIKIHSTNYGYWKGKKQPDYMVNKRSVSMLGKNKGKTLSEVHKIKISETMKGMTRSEEFKKKVSAGMKGINTGRYKGKHWKTVDGKRVWFKDGEI